MGREWAPAAFILVTSSPPLQLPYTDENCSLNTSQPHNVSITVSVYITVDSPRTDVKTTTMHHRPTRDVANSALERCGKPRYISSSARTNASEYGWIFLIIKVLWGTTTHGVDSRQICSHAIQRSAKLYEWHGKSLVRRDVSVLLFIHLLLRH